MTSYTVTESDAEQLIALAVGDELRIELPQSGGTGFIWSVDSTPDPMHEESDSVQQRTALPGGTGTRVLVLRATKAGRGNVELSLARPWAGGETDRRLQFPIEVH